MKIVALIAAIPALILGFALLFSAVTHPAWRLAAIGFAYLLVGIRFPSKGRAAAWQIDEACNPPPRYRGRGPFLALAMLFLGACRPAATTTPEPAQVLELDCGGRSCAMTVVANVTLITVQE